MQEEAETILRRAGFQVYHDDALPPGFSASEWYRREALVARRHADRLLPVAMQTLLEQLDMALNFAMTEAQGVKRAMAAVHVDVEERGPENYGIVLLLHPYCVPAN